MTTKAQREAAVLRRLKQRLYRYVADPSADPSAWVRSSIDQAVNDWHAAERKRGGR